MVVVSGVDPGNIRWTITKALGIKPVAWRWMVLREWDGIQSKDFESLDEDCEDWSVALAILGRLSGHFSFQADDWKLLQVRPLMFGGMHSPSGCLVGLLATASGPPKSTPIWEL